MPAPAPPQKIRKTFFGKLSSALLHEGVWWNAGYYLIYQRASPFVWGLNTAKLAGSVAVSLANSFTGEDSQKKGRLSQFFTHTVNPHFVNAAFHLFNASVGAAQWAELSGRDISALPHWMTELGGATPPEAALKMANGLAVGVVAVLLGLRQKEGFRAWLGGKSRWAQMALSPEWAFALPVGLMYPKLLAPLGAKLGALTAGAVGPREVGVALLAGMGALIAKSFWVGLRKKPCGFALRNASLLTCAALNLVAIGQSLALGGLPANVSAGLGLFVGGDVAYFRKEIRRNREKLELSPEH